MHYIKVVDYRLRIKKIIKKDKDKNKYLISFLDIFNFDPIMYFFSIFNRGCTKIKTLKFFIFRRPPHAIYKM